LIKDGAPSYGPHFLRADPDREVEVRVVAPPLARDRQHMFVVHGESVVLLDDQRPPVLHYPCIMIVSREEREPGHHRGPADSTERESGCLNGTAR